MQAMAQKYGILKKNRRVREIRKNSYHSVGTHTIWHFKKMQIFTFAALTLIDVYTKNSDSTWKNKRFEKKNEVNRNKIDDFRAICIMA